MKHIPGADPELVLLNHYYEELDVSWFVLFLIFVNPCIEYFNAKLVVKSLAPVHILVSLGKAPDPKISLGAMSLVCDYA